MILGRETLEPPSWTIPSWVKWETASPHIIVIQMQANLNTGVKGTQTSQFNKCFNFF